MVNGMYRRDVADDRGLLPSTAPPFSFPPRASTRTSIFKCSSLLSTQHWDDMWKIATATNATTSTASPPTSAVNTPPTQRRARSRGYPYILCFFFCIISIGFFYSVEVFQHRCLQQTAMLSLFHRLAQLHLCLRLLLLLRTLISYFVTCFIFLFANWIFLWIIQSTTIDALNELFVALQGIALMLLYREILF